ncbi:extracellular solute-binding protein [Catenulispora subtropica]|uniref:Sugar ABC transporter substrate-binding protein n=1 Tax=Catenulispora subtropica TaxID=450798 RepID=A0ABN2QQL1_9ACTN
MKHRLTAGITAAALAATALAGCSSSSSGSSGSPGGGKITLTFSSYAWQEPTVAANKKIVADWNASHPDVQVQYIPVDANSVHDKLVTQFSSHTAPDIIHDEAADIAGFAQQGYLAKLDGLLPADLKSGIPQGVWDSATVNGSVYGVPSLLQSYTVFANTALLKQDGITLPTTSNPWTWQQFQAAAKQATTNGVFGVGWGLKSPVSTVVSMSLNYGGKFFYSDNGKTTMRFTAAEQQVPKTIHDMIFQDKSIAPTTVTEAGSDVLPGFLGGKYAMIVGGNYLSQQILKDKTGDFQWTMLPLLKGDTQNQMADPQTYSIARQSQHPQQAMQFLDYFLNAEHLSALAQGDWLAPSSTAAQQRLLADTKGQDGWEAVSDSVKYLVNSPTSQLSNYPRWKSQIATPAFQGYLAGSITLEQLGQKLTDGWNQVGAAGN